MITPEFLKNINPSDLEEMSDDELQTLHDNLHSAYDPDEVGEDLINAHIFIIEEFARRDIPHTPEDELDRKSKELTESYEPPWVPFIVTHQAVSISGSSIYGEDTPNDLDWIIRHPERLPELETEIANALPKVHHHFVYELKGPNSPHIPFADFILMPKSPAPLAKVIEGQNSNTLIPVLKDILTAPAIIKPYLFRERTESGYVYRINSDVADSGTAIKIGRLLEEATPAITFSTIARKDEEEIGILMMQRYGELAVVDTNEPEFKKYYVRKP